MNNNKCKICNSEMLEGGSFETMDNRVSQDVECLDCCSTWTDVYTLSDQTNVMDDFKRIKRINFLNSRAKA
jgi:hypothetical protein